MNVKVLGNVSNKEREKIIQLIATAGKLSRSDGTVSTVFESNSDYEKNVKLIQRILKSGHRSIAEHDYLVFALEDVTPIVEQTMINHRLASFTVKSRRNVDFRNVGFYTPNFMNNNGNVLVNNEALQFLYNKSMIELFNKYGELVDRGLPFEDCRYILPYSYHSNFIMGCDVNVLFRVIGDLLYGKESKITELKELGLILTDIIEELVPYLMETLERESKRGYYEDKLDFLDNEILDAGINIDNELLSNVNMIEYTKYPDLLVLCHLIKRRKRVSFYEAQEILYKLIDKNPSIAREMMQGLLHSKKQRELEQVNFTFEMPISLAVLTHITRHRMQSLEVPDFVPMWNLDDYIVPESIKNTCNEEFKEIFANNKKLVDFFKKKGVRDEDLIYFYLSGNACNISTTMNGRTLEWISRMRCCNKAQWEIRDLINACVEKVKDVAPLIGEGLGPTCRVEGYCPEGTDSCNNRGVVFKKVK